MYSEKVVWSSRAQKDLIQIYNYISKDSLYYAQKTVNEIVKKTNKLYDFPQMGRKIENIQDIDYRELIYKSYKIIYKVQYSTIYIHRIWHSARLINNLFLKK